MLTTLYPSPATPLTLAGGKWESDAFPAPAYEWFQLQCRVKVDGPAYWAAIFTDAEGHDLVSDHYDGIDAGGGWQEIVSCFRSRPPAVSARIRFHLNGGKTLAVSQAAVAPVTREEVAAWADALRTGLEPFPSLVGSRRITNLPDTQRILRSGGRLRLVMLGDSIMNDIGNSPWDVLVERYHPGVHIEAATSVGASKGYAYYKQNDRVRACVLQYEPDLVMICMRSHPGDFDSLRDVIHQIRAGGVHDILLLSDPFGGDGDPRQNPGSQPPAAKVAGQTALRAIAHEMDAEFLNLQSLWMSYIAATRHPYPFFMRDLHHANLRGRQVIARVLEDCFAGIKAEVVP